MHELRIPGVSSAAILDVHSPYSGEVVGQVDTVDLAGMRAAIGIAAKTFADQKNWLPAYRRAEILGEVSRRIAERSEELARLAASEGGKPLTDSMAEVRRASNTIALCAQEAVRRHGEELPMGGTAAGDGHLAFTIREPIGVVAAISAFNHPCNLIAHQVGTAIAAGCPVLIKPDSRTPLSCFALVEMFYDAGLPPEWAMAVPCETTVAEMLATSDQIAFLSFIGSARVGWHLHSKVAPGVRCALEHGGIAPAIVDETADLDAALPLLVKAGYVHAGQVCVSLQRVFVHNTIRGQFVERFLTAANALKVGDPLDPATEVGPIIDEKAIDRIDEAVQASKAIAVGGKRLANNCYQPTVLLDPPADSSVMTDEIFGPVVCIRGYDELDEAIKCANSDKWSFQSAIFTQDIGLALRAAKNLNAATVSINEHPAFRVDWMPFGGRKQSGIGVGGVAPSVAELTQAKLIVAKGW